MWCPSIGHLANTRKQNRCVLVATLRTGIKYSRACGYEQRSIAKQQSRFPMCCRKQCSNRCFFLSAPSVSQLSVYAPLASRLTTQALMTKNHSGGVVDNTWWSTLIGSHDDASLNIPGTIVHCAAFLVRSHFLLSSPLSVWRFGSVASRSLSYRVPAVYMLVQMSTKQRLTCLHPVPASIRTSVYVHESVMFVSQCNVDKLLEEWMGRVSSFAVPTTNPLSM